MLKKILSFVLVILIMLQSLPLNTLAAEKNYLADNYTEEYIATSGELKGTEILSEITEKRDKNTKHFLLSDGSFMVTQYDTPIHYQDTNGNWIDYDNSVSKINATDEQISLFGNVDLYKTNNLINNVVFAAKGNSNTLLAYENVEYPISLNYKSSKNSKIKINNNATQLNGNDRFLTLTNINQEVIYEDIFRNADLQYIVNPTGIKENIILKNNNASNIFTVNYNIGELKADIIDDHTINLLAQDAVIYTISAPLMYDANGEISTAVKLNVTKNKNGKLTVEIVADNSWLQSEERIYPVKIDPYIFQANKDINNDASALEYNSSSYPHGSLYVGKNSTYGKCRSFLKYELPTLSPGDMFRPIRFQMLIILTIQTAV